MELMRKDWGTGKDAIHDCDCSNLIGLEASWEAFGRAVMLDEDKRKRGATDAPVSESACTLARFVSLVWA